MSPLTAKTDEEVGLILGPMLGAWEPLSLPEIVKSANPPTTSTNGCVVSTLSICAFLAVTAAAIASGVYFKSVVVGFVVAFGLVIPITMLATRFSRIAHLRTRLGVFERGMRCGRSVIRFDELKVITFGAPKTFAERHMPTLRSGQKSIEKSEAREASERIECSRRIALTMVMNNGKHVVWLSFHVMYPQQAITEFFELLDQHAHAQLRGLDLTEAERRRVEDL